MCRAATYLFCCLAWNKTLSHAGSLRGFGVIDSIKTQIEAICNQTVSCADILTVATRDSVVALGGPSWTVPLRRDSIDANEAEANSDLPGFNSSRSELEAAFLRKGGLNTVDMVALSGAHTIGQAQCSTFRARIYGGDTNINAAYAASLRANCPRQSAPVTAAWRTWTRRHPTRSTTPTTPTSYHRGGSCTRTRCCSTTTPLTTLSGTLLRTRQRSAAPSRRP
ncbi:hypothetical protein VPH35_034996 [Triticum aestivum]